MPSVWQLDDRFDALCSGTSWWAVAASLFLSIAWFSKRKYIDINAVMCVVGSIQNDLMQIPCIRQFKAQLERMGTQHVSCITSMWFWNVVYRHNFMIQWMISLTTVNGAKNSNYPDPHILNGIVFADAYRYARLTSVMEMVVLVFVCRHHLSWPEYSLFAFPQPCSFVWQDVPS